ncbi:MAG TPA: LysR family transcriptional regulator [Lacipirellulaceae bacterium]|nr:LysR family transcriptional regulator [Lacipirellulaceae bacterium]
MNLRQVEIFCAVMRCRTTIAAAYELGVSQPAVSNAIKHLESQLGFALFNRIGNRLLPTTEADSLFADAEPLQTMARAISTKARDLKDTKVGHLRIYATHALRNVIPKAIRKFLKTRPEVLLFFDTLPMERVVEVVESGFADLGVALLPAHRPGMARIPILEGRMVVAIHPKHPLAARNGPLTPRELKREQLIGLEPVSRLGPLVRQAFDAAHVPYNPGVEVRHCSAACALVQEGIGIAIVDEFSASGADASQLAVRPFSPLIPITGYVLHLDHRPLSRLARRCLEEMQKSFSGE